MRVETAAPLPAAALVAMIRDADARTGALVADLDERQLIGPRLATVNPLLWEIGHVAWFSEYFVLRTVDGRPSFLANADPLYDSIRIYHSLRWDIPLPTLAATLDYRASVRDALVDRLGAGTASPRDSYFTQLAVYHEDMHDEAFTYGRQTLGYPAPRFARAATAGAGPWPGDAEIPGGTHLLGGRPDQPFVFDNEKWGHTLAVAPFRIARATVTAGAFAAFADDGGYRRREWWSDDGWAWRVRAGAEAPLYWERDGTRWLVRRFDAIEPVAPHAAMVHVNWHEANAYCRWAGRRLPTEAEWEVAASRAPDGRGGLAPEKRRYPWGDAAPDATRAALDATVAGPVDVAAFPDGDSAFGCRQMIGNVWEWTADAFAPFPGFSADPYREYSAPWFYDHKVLRGGSWTTRGRCIWNTWRNFYQPQRRDLFAGFRTCAL
ncbi:MAG: ergothioneine biosynthesis protein EgtB [Alphaproteobacteria bacterium]|nr:ergothioneine biosynthesis protein EgtB [Alphaproteobacteria bacterium]